MSAGIRSARGRGLDAEYPVLRRQRHVLAELDRVAA